jgi:hypothetical protein
VDAESSLVLAETARRCLDGSNPVMANFDVDPGVGGSDLTGFDESAGKGNVFQSSLAGKPVLEHAERDAGVGGKAFELSHSFRRLLISEKNSRNIKVYKNLIFKITA